MKSNPSWSENNMTNNPSNVSMLTTWPWDCHCGFVGEHCSSKTTRYRCILWSAVCKKKKKKKTETNTSQPCRCAQTHSHTHTSPLLYFTHLKYSVSSCTSMHIYTPTNVHVCVYEWVSIPLLFFVLVAVYYRSQLCNCVGGGSLFSPHLSLSLSFAFISSSLALFFSYSFSWSFAPKQGSEFTFNWQRPLTDCKSTSSCFNSQFLLFVVCLTNSISSG